MIDWYRPIETEDGRQVHPNPRYWPNPVSLEHCGVVYADDGSSTEHWWDDEGKPVSQDAPRIRNVRNPVPDSINMIRERFHSDITPNERAFLVDLLACLQRRAAS